MRSGNSSNNNYTKTNYSNEPIQNLWCRDTFWQHIIDKLNYSPFKETPGCHLRSCRYPANECRGAHSEDRLKLYAPIVKFNFTNKSKYDWVLLYLTIIKTIQNDATKLINIEHKFKTDNVSRLTFIEAIQLWRDLACFYRKLSKELPAKSATTRSQYAHLSGYTYSDDVPIFNLLNYNFEDFAWSFVRLTRRCPTHQKFDTSIKSGIKVTIWDVCLAPGSNCKEGVHNKEESLCIDDFMDGKCSCISLQEIERSKMELQHKITKLSKQLVKIEEENIANTHKKDEVDDTDDLEMWIQSSRKQKKCINKIKEDPKIKINQEIKSLTNEIKDLSSARSIHYTEQGMMPFNQQYILFKQLKEKESEEKITVAPVVVKESWDHGMINSVITKPVIKLVKPASRKAI